jgi:DNA-binding SARP family transcriptional activator
VEIQLLGSVALRVDPSRRLDIKANKVRALLATLALDAGRTVSRVELMDELWSGRALNNVGNALQATATRLRKVLDASCRGSGDPSPQLRTVYNGYQLDLPAAAVDAVRFQCLATEGRALVRDEPRRAISLIEQALALWQGPALLDAGDGMRCRSAAARLEEARLTSWEDLITARMLLQEGRVVLGDLRQLVEQYPLRERFCEQLMLVLYRWGQQSEALRTFHRTRQRLDEELGLEPSEALRHRYDEILVHDPVLMSPAAAWRWRDRSTETRTALLRQVVVPEAGAIRTPQ